MANSKKGRRSHGHGIDTSKKMCGLTQDVFKVESLGADATLLRSLLHTYCIWFGFDFVKICSSSGKGARSAFFYMRNDQKSLVMGPVGESRKFHIYIGRELCRDNGEV